MFLAETLKALNRKVEIDKDFGPQLLGLTVRAGGYSRTRLHGFVCGLSKFRNPQTSTLTSGPSTVVPSEEMGLLTKLV